MIPSDDHRVHPAAELLLDAVPRLMQVISAESQSAGPAGGLTPTQLRVLGALVRGVRLPSELARDLRISPATVSEVVDLLARRGLVERRDDPDDRRVSVLVPTAAGTETWRSARERALAALGHIVSRLSEDEARSLEVGLGAIRRVATLPGSNQREEANAS